MINSHFLPYVWASFVVLSTTLFCKLPVVWVLTLNSWILFTLWRMPERPSVSLSPFFLWGGITSLLLIHTACFALNVEFSFSSLLRVSSLLLQVALLHMCLQHTRLFASLFNFSSRQPLVLSLLGVFVFALVGLHIQFGGESFLTQCLNVPLNFLHLPLLRLPPTFKPHLTLLTLGFFAFLGVSTQSSLWQLRFLCPLVLGFALFCSGLLMHAHTVCIALLLGVAGFLLYQKWPRWTGRLSGFLMVSSFFCLPWLMRFLLFLIPPDSTFFQTLPHTLKQRLVHWNDLLTFLSDKLWSGYGLGYSRILSQQADLSLPLMFPHNMILELWLDLGLSGVCLVSGLFFIGLRRLSGHPDLLTRATGFACVVFVFIINQTAYSNLHIWWASAVCLVSFWIPLLRHKASQEAQPLDALITLKSAPDKGGC